MIRIGKKKDHRLLLAYQKGEQCSFQRRKESIMVSSIAKANDLLVDLILDTLNNKNLSKGSRRSQALGMMKYAWTLGALNQEHFKRLLAKVKRET